MLLRSWYALANLDLVVSSYLFVLMTPLIPQSLHLLLGFPTLFESFLTKLNDPYLRHFNISEIMMEK